MTYPIIKPETATIWLDKIFSLVWDIYEFFHAAYMEVSGWWIPFRYLSFPLYHITQAIWNLLYPISIFTEQFKWVFGRIGFFLSAQEIKTLLSHWLGYAEQAWNWTLNAWSNVYNIVNAWWSATQNNVKAWIDEAVGGFRTLVNQLAATTVEIGDKIELFIARLPALDQLVSWWSNWRGELLAIVNNWWSGALGEVQRLIDSAFVVREGFWAGWQDWRDKVTEFFTDPEEWLYKAFDRIIERFW